ncbi:hypothetical protein DER46DRAFT_404146 [Fusarium sp. MPI-SDFR-AT-0072]|nr:hypothetical protein DER46DRAFT_404146 [Fusarium sp. MPI-SDFR-AT-0072]
MAQALAHWHHILLSLIILYPIDLPLPTFATHFQSRYTNYRNALNKAEELYQDAEKARTEKLETYMDATKAMTGAHRTLSSAMIRKANATKDVARLEMIKDAREAIEKRDNQQIQVDKQRK